MSRAAFESGLFLTAPSGGRGTRASAASASVLLHAGLLAGVFLAPLTRLPGEPAVASPFRTILAPPSVAPPIFEVTPVAARSRTPARSAPARARVSPPTQEVSPDALVLFTDPVSTADPMDSESLSDLAAREDAGAPCVPGALCAGPSIPGDPELRHDPPRVGGLIAEPRLLEGRAPVYPGVAIAARVSATVIIEAHVLPDGRVREARILKGHPLFDEAALESVRARRYEPLRLNGVPTDFLVTITVTFRLRG